VQNSSRVETTHQRGSLDKKKDLGFWMSADFIQVNLHQLR